MLPLQFQTVAPEVSLTTFAFPASCSRSHWWIAGVEFSASPVASPTSDLARAFRSRGRLVCHGVPDLCATSGKPGDSPGLQMRPDVQLSEIRVCCVSMVRRRSGVQTVRASHSRGSSTSGHDGIESAESHMRARVTSSVSSTTVSQNRPPAS